ncbi:MAG: homoserine kinase, partial [Trichococcus flocculiformis]
MFDIRVPATSANLGPGFDSLGLAVSLYLTLTVKEEADEWEILHDLGAGIPTDKTNLIIETALSLAPDMAPRKITMTSEVPAARGLGS